MLEPALLVVVVKDEHVSVSRNQDLDQLGLVQRCQVERDGNAHAGRSRKPQAFGCEARKVLLKEDVEELVPLAGHGGRPPPLGAEGDLDVSLPGHAGVTRTDGACYVVDLFEPNRAPWGRVIDDVVHDLLRPVQPC